MDADALTAAPPSLPLGTRLLVENVENGERVVVRINDRGPFAVDRIIDLPRAAAERLDMVKHGVAKVRGRHVDDALAGVPRPLDIE
jgi:rare lipoprotein A